jgi:hypothetical protein
MEKKSQIYCEPILGYGKKWQISWLFNMVLNDTFNNISVIPWQLSPLKVVSSNTVHGEVYSIQHYVIKFVSDLQEVGGLLQLLRFPPPIK